MSTHRLAIVLFVVLMVIGASELRAQSPTPAPSKAATVGAAIGDGISAAITTAFPGISKIIELIWPNRAGGKPNTDSKTKTDASAAAPALAKDPAVQKGMASLDAISSELQTVSVFLSHCVIADNNVVAMEELLRGRKWPLAAPDKLRLDNYWIDTEDRIKQLSGTAAALPQLGNPSLQSVFRAVADANIGKLDQITNTAKNVDPSAKEVLQDQLAKLDAQLSAVNALSGEILVSVAAGLKDAKQKATGAQGLIPTSAEHKKAMSEFDKVLATRYPALAR